VREPETLARALTAAAFIAILAGCGPSYPKKDLEGSIRELFRKELGAEVRTGLVGKTLYVSLDIDNMVSPDLDLPKDALKKLEDAMLSISRISLSTDAEIDYTVIEARDPVWGVETRIVRKMQDLKDLFYWRISKPDFDERLVLEMRKVPPGSALPGDDWRDLSLQEYLGRWMASRINMGARANPFLGVLLGIGEVEPDYDQERKTLSLTVSGAGYAAGVSTVTAVSGLLRESIVEQAALAEKKYGRFMPEGTPWAEAVDLKNPEGQVILRIDRADWTTPDRKNKETTK